MVFDSSKRELLTEAEAAAVLRLKRHTLAHWRTVARYRGKRKGPAYIQSGKGRVLYLLTDIDAWIEANRREP